MDTRTIIEDVPASMTSSMALPAVLLTLFVILHIYELTQKDIPAFIHPIAGKDVEVLIFYPASACLRTT